MTVVVERRRCEAMTREFNQCHCFSIGKIEGREFCRKHYREALKAFEDGEDFTARDYESDDQRQRQSGEH